MFFFFFFGGGGGGGGGVVCCRFPVGDCIMYYSAGATFEFSGMIHP